MFSNFYIFRFINLVESLDHNIATESVKIVRTRFLQSYNGYECTYLLTNEEIKSNILSFKALLNTSSSNPNITYHSQKNLTKGVINSAAELFLYLNSCPENIRTSVEETEEFFRQVFKGVMFEPTNLGIILYTLNAMKLFPNDGRIIALNILGEVSALFNLSVVQSKKKYKILTEDSTFSKCLQFKFCHLLSFWFWPVL